MLDNKLKNQNKNCLFFFFLNQSIEKENSTNGIFVFKHWEFLTNQRLNQKILTQDTKNANRMGEIIPSRLTTAEEGELEAQ